MTCPECGAETVAFEVSPRFHEFLRGDETAVALCTGCLGLHPATDPPGDPQFERIHDSFPADPEAAIPLAMLLGMLDELALYRTEIADLLETVERAGVDPLLVVSRLESDPDIASDVDLETRRHQLIQLL